MLLWCHENVHVLVHVIMSMGFPCTKCIWVMTVGAYVAVHCPLHSNEMLAFIIHGSKPGLKRLLLHGILPSTWNVFEGPNTDVRDLIELRLNQNKTQCCSSRRRSNGTNKAQLIYDSLAAVDRSKVEGCAVDSWRSSSMMYDVQRNVRIMYPREQLHSTV